MKAIIFGVGAVGARVARQFVSGADTQSVQLIDEDLSVAQAAQTSLGDTASITTISGLRLETRLDRFREACDGVDVVVLTAPDDQVELAEVALKAGAHVISTSDDVDTVKELLELDQVASEAGRYLVVGAGFAPGLTCLLTRHAADQFDVVDEIHVAKFGTGGPACARQHHKALRSEALDWRNQQWEKRRGGSGRELVWFPDPVGGLDCYQGALPDALLLLRAFPEVVRATTRVAATRRDQGTKWMPMMRRPHPEGMIGAVRTEVRGWKGDLRDAVIFGALDRPAVAAGIVAAVMGELAVAGSLAKHGAGGVADMVVETMPVFETLAERGVKAAVFEGSPRDV